MIAIDLSGKTAIVTGASQGLGQATAAMLHRAGAAVVVNYFEDAHGANRANADQLVHHLADRALAVAADVRDVAAVRAMFERAKQSFGAIDIVVNNAGILRDRTIAKMSQTEWQDVIDTNLTGVFHVSKVAAEFLPDGGRIINLASVSAMVGVFGQANYVASKAGVIGLTKVLARELAKRHITVNAVAPGVVLTDMGLSIPESARSQMLSQIPLSRFAEPDEIAAAILFLASDLAAYITAQTVHVNGGWWV
jgi:3-oxoacyl-[acyl-carrier protein] reductase